MNAKKDMASEIKSAYELALERLETEGIERPRQDDLDSQTREQIAEIRSRIEAKLAELEILHRDQLATLDDPVERAKAEENYVAERQRLDTSRDRDIAKLRSEV